MGKNEVSKGDASRVSKYGLGSFVVNVCECELLRTARSLRVCVFLVCQGAQDGQVACRPESHSGFFLLRFASVRPKKKKVADRAGQPGYGARVDREKEDRMERAKKGWRRCLTYLWETGVSTSVLRAIVGTRTATERERELIGSKRCVGWE